MKTTSWILLFLLFATITPASFANKNTEYLHLIYAAEEEIMLDNYKQALQRYNEAFDLKKEKIFAEDIYNALTCALIIKDQTQSRKLLNQLAKSGVGEAFINTKFGSKFAFDKSYFEAQCKIAKKVKRNFEQQNQKLSAIIDKLEKEDQYFHTLWADYIQTKKIDFAKIEEDSMYTAMSIADKRISKELKKIYDNGNTLSEFQLGAFTHSDTSLDNKGKAYIIIMHNYQGVKTADTLFNPILKQQIENGDIKPLVFTLMSDANNNKLKKDYGNTVGYVAFKDQELYYNKFVYGNSEWNKSLDENRKSIHLYPLVNQLARLYYKKKRNTHDFVFFTASLWGNATIEPEYFDKYKP